MKTCVPRADLSEAGGARGSRFLLHCARVMVYTDGTTAAAETLYLQFHNWADTRKSRHLCKDKLGRMMGVSMFHYTIFGARKKSTRAKALGLDIHCLG